MINSSSVSGQRYSALHSCGPVIGCDCCHTFVLNILFTCLGFASGNTFRQMYVWITNYYCCCYFSLGSVEIYTLRCKWQNASGTVELSGMTEFRLQSCPADSWQFISYTLHLSTPASVYFKISAFKYLWDPCCFNYLSLWPEVSLLCWG